MRDMLVRNGLRPELAHFAPYGIDLGPFENSPAKERSNRLRLGFIGTLYEHKGAHVLLEAVASLPKDIPIVVKVYGDHLQLSGYVSRLKKIAKGDRRIEFCGVFPNSEIAKVLSGLDVLVVPSLWYENTPLVIYSAQAAKTPVIATNLGGMAEVVHHEKNGLLFEKGDVPGLAALIRRAVAESDLLPRLAANAASPRSISVYAGALEGMYRKTLDAPRTP